MSPVWNYVLKDTQALPLDGHVRKEVIVQRLGGWSTLVEGPLEVQALGRDELRENLLLAEAASRRVRVEQRDDGLVHCRRGEELAHAVFGLEVAAGAVHEHVLGARHVPLDCERMRACVSEPQHNPSRAVGEGW